ncbi:MAG: hypothetical protein ACKOQY_11505, partial [Bacteroidota bacterium]
MHQHFTRTLYFVQPLCFLMFLTSFLLSSLGAWAQSGTQTFTGNGTFTVPPGVTSITVECWGGGGSGGRGGGSPFQGGGGAAGGQYATSVISNVSQGTTFTVNIGSGGVAPTT